MRHFGAYLQERFPLQANGLLIVSYFSANYMLAQGALAPAAPIQISWSFAAGCVVLLLMFFHMRVIDEHKDYALDRVVHPDRVLSQGLVTLEQLRMLGIASVCVEVVLSLVLGIPALLACIFVLFLTWLVYHQFFAARLLNQHLFLNALVHLIIMPAYCLYVFSAATRHFAWSAPAVVLLYAWVSYGVGLAYELTRKTRVPADERPGLITYSRTMGPYAPANLALAALGLSSAVSVAVGLLLDFEVWYHATVVVLLLIVGGGVLRYRLHTTRTTASQLQMYAGAFIFAFDVLATAQLIRLHGVSWG